MVDIDVQSEAKESRYSLPREVYDFSWGTSLICEP